MEAISVKLQSMLDKGMEISDKVEFNPLTLECGDVETYFGRCEFCELGGNCRDCDIYLPDDGVLAFWDTYQVCDSCRYIAEYGVEMED